MTLRLTVLFERAGVPVELEGPADWRRAIARGHIRRDTLVTAIGRGPPQMVPAENVPELASIFAEAEPQGSLSERPQPVAEQAPQQSTRIVAPPIASTVGSRDKIRDRTRQAEPKPDTMNDVDPKEAGSPVLSAYVAPQGKPWGSGSAWAGGLFAVMVLIAGVRGCGSAPETQVGSNSVVDSGTSSSPVSPEVVQDTFVTSFNCRRATAPAERLICGNGALAKRDLDLAALYARLVSDTTGQDQQLLRQGQRAWLRLRDGCIYEPYAEPCLERVYDDRISSLRAFSLAAESSSEDEVISNDEAVMVDANGNPIDRGPSTETSSAPPKADGGPDEQWLDEVLSRKQPPELPSPTTSRPDPLEPRPDSSQF